jgi:hypothetical protein
MTLARSGWLITADDQGQVAQDYKNLGFQCTAFDGEVEAVQLALHAWVHSPTLRRFDYIVIHPDS